MSHEQHTELSKCVRCGACKARCPTYFSTLDETMGARGRIAILAAVEENELVPSKGISDKIFSCILCEACSGLCPTGINIPEAIYQARTGLKDHYSRGRLLRKIFKYSLSRMDTAYSVLKVLRKFIYPPLHMAGILRYMPKAASTPFNSRVQVYKNTQSRGRIALFTGCSVNYLYTHLGDSLVRILITEGYEVVVLKGEVCCGAPMRALGFENEAAAMARKNVELFNKLNVEAILSMCPTCTLTVRKQYPLLIGDTINKMMDVNEFFIKYETTRDLKTVRRVVTYHDPCHLGHGLGIKHQPREILKNIEGLTYIEMPDEIGRASCRERV